MIFVTGGTGFLGRHLIPLLCRSGHDMRVLTRYPQRHSWLRQYAGVEVVRGDLRTGAGLDMVQGCDYVIHAAGLFSMWNQAGDFQATNVEGTQALVRAAAEADIQRFIYVSTVAVIGNPQPGRVIDEQHPPRPADDYQASKLLAEQIVWEANVPAVVLRAGAFYGPLGDYAFNRLFFTDALRGLQMQMDGGHYVIFPVFIQDVAQAILLALTRGEVGELYNICGECLSHREIFQIVRAHAGIRYPPLNIPGWLGRLFARVLTAASYVTGHEPFYPLSLRSYVFNDWYVSSEKAKHDLGFRPIPFNEGAARTVKWYQNGKPDWFAELEC